MNSLVSIPITRKQAASITQMSLPDRLAIEGYPFTTLAAFNGTAANNASIGSLTMPGITKAFWLESILVSSNKNAVIQVGMTANYLGGSNYANYFEVVVAPGIPVSIPVRQLLRPAPYTSSTGSLSLGGATFKTVIDADGTNAYARVSAVGYQITDDLNFGAEKVLLHIGDSITAGGTGITQKTKQYDWQTLNYFKGKGISVRMVNMSISGSTSVDHERLRQYGTYDMPKVDYISYSLGANDASAANAPSLVQANVAAMIAQKQALYPAATMVVYGSTPNENNTNEANAVNIRAAVQTAVTTAADPKVFFLNLGAAFDRTNLANYATSDPAGTHIHPSDAGHAQVFTVIKNFLDANPNIRP